MIQKTFFTTSPCFSMKEVVIFGHTFGQGMAVHFFQKGLYQETNGFIKRNLLTKREKE
jgi:hypothetical protein